MNLLWCTVDHATKLMPFMDPWRRDLAQVEGVQVRSIVRAAPRMPIDICRRACKGEVFPPLVTPEDAAWADWLITDAMYAFLEEDWSRLPCRKAILWSDCHGPMVEKYVARAFEVGFDLFLPFYRAGQQAFQSYLPPEQVHWLPYAVDGAVFNVWDEEKTSDILLTGVVHPNVYPLRQQIHQDLSGLPGFRYVARPQEPITPDTWPMGEDYARLLSSAWIGATGLSRFGYSLGKLFEIPACGAVLACDWLPEMLDLGFLPEVNCLIYDKRHRPGPQLLQWAEDKDRLRAIAQAGAALIRDRHTTAARVQELAHVLQLRL